MKKILLIAIIATTMVYPAFGAMKLKPVDTLHDFVAAAADDDGVIYGYGCAGNSALCKYDPSSDTVPVARYAFYTKDFLDESGAPDVIGQDATTEQALISAVWAKDSGVVFAVIKIGRAASASVDKCWLFKSVDGGVSFGNNSPTYDNGYPVMGLGFTDGTGTVTGTTLDGTIANQTPEVWTLYQYGFCELNRTPPGSGTALEAGDILLGEYNTYSDADSGASTDYVRMMQSVDNGDNWTEVVHWNSSSTQVDHIHNITQSPATGYIYVGTGDSDAESGIFRWDGAATITDDTAPKDMDDESSYGAIGRGGQQRWRIANIQYSGGYMIWSTDAVAAGESGIMRMLETDFEINGPSFVYYAPDSSDTTSYQGYPWFGANLGGYFFNIYYNNVTVAARDKRMWVLGSDDSSGSAFRRVGHLNTYINNANKFFPEGVFVANNQLVIGSKYFDWDGATGQDGGTVFLELSDEMTLADNPDYHIFWPVKWVRTTGNDSTGDGLRPSTAWRTLEQALEGDRIAIGTRVDLCETATFSAGEGVIVPDWDAATDNYDSDSVTVIMGNGAVNTIWDRTDDTQTYSMYIDDANGTTEEGIIVFADIGMTTSDATDEQFIRLNDDAQVVLHNTIIDQPNDLSGGAALRNEGKMWVYNSRIVMKDGPTQTSMCHINVAAANAQTYCYNNEFLFGAKVFQIGYSGILARIFGNTMYNYNTNVFHFQGTLDAAPDVVAKFNLLQSKYAVGGAAGLGYNDANTTLEQDGIFDYNLIMTAWNTNWVSNPAADPPGTHSLYGSAAKFTDASTYDFTLVSGSPGINIGYDNDAAALTHDKDGNARPFGGLIDAGAHEYQAP